MTSGWQVNFSSLEFWPFELLGKYLPLAGGKGLRSPSPFPSPVKGEEDDEPVM
jgi:hypothetical protein